MKDQSKRIYRRAAEAVVARQDGTTGQARGLVVRLWGKADSLTSGERHVSGLLESPLYVFTGWAEEAQPGDVLEQEGRRYTILKAGKLVVGGLTVAARLLLEGQVTDDSV